MSRRDRRTAVAAALACTSLIAAGCGASGVHDSLRAGSTQAARGVQPLPGPREAAAPREEAAAAQGGDVAGGTDAGGALPQGASAVAPTGTQHARHQHGMINDEVSASGAKPAGLCALVAQGSAQAIMGTEVRAPVLAPQGPTCIYSTRDSKRQVTLAIETTTPKGPPPQDRLRHRMRVKVGGRHAFCGVAGSPTLIVPLHGGRYLTVGAPCPIAAAFAGHALTRLGSS